MTDDIPASSQVRAENEEQGQKMTIFMPKGAVIIEKSEMELEPPVELEAKISLEETPESPKVGAESFHSLGSVINIYTGDGSSGVKEQSQPMALSADSASMNERQVLLHISEILDLISKRLDHNVQPIVQSVQPKETVFENANLIEENDKKSTNVREGNSDEGNAPSIGYSFDWIHALNLLYLTLILCTQLLPAGLTSLISTQLIPAISSYEVAGIQKGDLLVAKKTQAHSVVVGDVLALHNAFSGTSEVIQVSAISTSGDNGIVTIEIPPRAGQTLSLSYTVDGELELCKVVKAVPMLGTAKTLIDSYSVLYFAGLAVVLLNTIVHFRRHRRYSNSLRAHIDRR